MTVRIVGEPFAVPAAMAASVGRTAAPIVASPAMTDPIVVTYLPIVSYVSMPPLEYQHPSGPFWATASHRARYWCRNCGHTSGPALKSVGFIQDAMYIDKLDGTITPTYYDRRAAEFRADQDRIQTALTDHQRANQSDPAEPEAPRSGPLCKVRFQQNNPAVIGLVNAAPVESERGGWKWSGGTASNPLSPAELRAE